VTQSADRTSFDILIDRLGINLITGMKGSGKSYLAKRLLLKLIDNGILSIVFDVNAEYLNLRNADAHTPSQYADRMITFTPYLAHESDAERVLMIPCMKSRTTILQPLSTFHESLRCTSTSYSSVEEPGCRVYSRRP